MYDIPETGFLRLPQVLSVIPLGKTSWWEGVRSGRFPKPVKAASKKYFQDFPYNVFRILRTAAAEISSWQTLQCFGARVPIAKTVPTIRSAPGMPTSTF